MTTHLNNCTLPNLPVSMPSHHVTTSPTCFPFSRPLQPRSREAFSEPSHRKTFNNCTLPNLPISMPSHHVTTSPTCFPFSRPLQPRSREAFSEPSHRKTFARSCPPTHAITRTRVPTKPDLHLTPDSLAVFFV